jgi:beta-phosphoglucomutase family hydrolase
MQMSDSRGVLWDLDGVLVDTGEVHFQVWTEVFAGLGIHFSRDTFQKTFGMNNAGLLALMLGDGYTPQTAHEISAQKENLFRQTVRGQAVILPGVSDWLERLSLWGVHQAVASSAPHENIDTLIDELGIRRYFQAVISVANLPGKPDPGVFLNAAEAIRVPPNRCVVIEDAVAGVEAARRAGMKCVAVLTTNPAHRLSQADVIVERLDQLSPHTMLNLLGLPG